jgi:hypothetical protein
MIDRDSLFGHVNDSIRGLATEGQTDETWQFICECPDLDCYVLVALTLDEFDALRSAAAPAPILSESHAA